MTQHEFQPLSELKQPLLVHAFMGVEMISLLCVRCELKYLPSDGRENIEGGPEEECLHLIGVQLDVESGRPVDNDLLEVFLPARFVTSVKIGTAVDHSESVEAESIDLRQPEVPGAPNKMEVDRIRRALRSVAMDR